MSPLSWTEPSWFAASSSCLVLLSWLWSCLNSRSKSRTLLIYRCQSQTCCFSNKIYSDWSNNLEEEPASTDPHHLKTWLQMVNQRCFLDHPVYHHRPSPSPWICVHVCTNCVSICASVLSVYTKWFCGQFFFCLQWLSSSIYTFREGLWCYTWIYTGGMCLDFLVWSSTSRSGSHVLNLDASDVRLSSRFFGSISCVGGWV